MSFLGDDSQMKMPVDVIDAHHHLWPGASSCENPRLADLSPFDVAEYRQAMSAVNLLGSIHVETGWNGAPLDETQWLTARRAATGLPGAIVADADLTALDLDVLLAAQCAAGPVRGIRARLTGDRAALITLKSGDNPTCLTAWRNGYARLAQYGLSFELQATAALMPDAAVLADLFPDTILIISHAAFPFLPGGAGLDVWRRALDCAAARPNIIMKLSGLAMDRPALQINEIRAVLDPALELFGPERLMFGSNFPIDCRVLSPQVHLERHLAAFADLSPDERYRILAGTAHGVYRM